MKKFFAGLAVGVGVGYVGCKLAERYEEEIYAFASDVHEKIRPVLDAVVNGECPCKGSQFAEEMKCIIKGEAPVNAQAQEFCCSGCCEECDFEDDTSCVDEQTEQPAEETEESKDETEASAPSDAE